MQAEHIKTLIEKIKHEVSQHIVGQDKLINDTLICLMAEGNLLLEGVPGLGKTKLVKTLAYALGLDFKRIQFTPDLMPADITGTNIFNREKNSFSFQRGPVFSHIVLADEINRATPKTQGALLEAMQEKTVTVGGQTYNLETPYMVLATQNPIEQEGTYPLPEAQLDRFMFKLKVAFPDTASLSKIVSMTTSQDEREVSVVTDRESLLQTQHLIKTIPVAKPVMDFAMQLIIATHPAEALATDMVKTYIQMGASPRGAQNLIRGAKVKAIMENRYNVSFEDIKYIAEATLCHRLILNYEALSDNINVGDIIADLILKVKH